MGRATGDNGSSPFHTKKYEVCRVSSECDTGSNPVLTTVAMQLIASP